MAKATSPAPAKSGQAKTRGTTKTAAANTATPDETVAGTAPAAAPIVEPAAPVAGSTQIQDGEPNSSTSTENTQQDGTQPAAGAADGETAGEPTGEAGATDTQADEAAGDTTEPAPVLSATLVNHSNMNHRIVKARITLAPGESALIEFEGDKHREQCEKHVAQIRSLYRWAEGEGLHWSADA